MNQTNDNTTSQLGFIGLGRMGSEMAGRLLAAKHSLIVYDRDPAVLEPLARRGALIASSIQDLGAQADVVFLSLPTPQSVSEVVSGTDGLVHAARAKVVVDLSTTGPQVAKAVDAALSKRGITFIDCPVSGGITGAVDGTLALMAAGDPKTLNSIVPILKTMGQLFVVGESAGQGQMLKVINNLISTAALTMSCEALVLGVKAGLDPDQMIDVINASSGRNTSTTQKIPCHVLPRTFDFGMPIGLSSKDARLCLEEGDRLGVPMVIGHAVRQMLNITRDQFGADTDMTAVIRTIEQWAGVEVRGAAAKTE